MKYTAGELRQMNWRKCKLQYWDKPEAEGEIYVVDWSVSFVTNALPYKGDWEKKKWYKYTWTLYYNSRTDKYIDDSISITFIDEPHQNIYYDDNGEIIKEWDWVLVGEDKLKRIFLWKIPRAIWNYIYLSGWEEWVYRNTRCGVSALSTNICIKYKEPEKKLRELMLTDEEYEEIKNKYNSFIF